MAARLDDPAAVTAAHVARKQVEDVMPIVAKYWAQVNMGRVPWREAVGRDIQLPVRNVAHDTRWDQVGYGDLLLGTRRMQLAHVGPDGTRGWVTESARAHSYYSS